MNNHKTFNTNSFVSVTEQLLDTFNEIEDTLSTGKSDHYIDTGYKDLDLILGGGFPRGKITLVHGVIWKTTFLLNILKRANSITSKSSAYFSSHHDSSEIVFNLISSESKIPINRLKRVYVAQQEFEPLIKTVENLSEASIYLSNPLGKEFTPEFIATTLTEIRETEGIKLDLIVVDSINHMKITTGEKGSERFERYAFELQDIARENDVAILLTANTIKEIRNRVNKRPFSSDVFLSSYINHYCENIIALYYDSYYYTDTPDRGIIEMDLQKGYSCGVLKFVINPETLELEGL